MTWGVVVTGASGNVGTSVLTALGQDPAVKEIVGLARRRPQMSFVKTTWRGRRFQGDLAPLFEGADVVIHLAWLIQPSTRWRANTPRERERGRERARVRGRGPGGCPSACPRVLRGCLRTRTGRSSSRVLARHRSAKLLLSRHKAEVEQALDAFEADRPQVRTVRQRPKLETPPLSRKSSGALHCREFRSGIGASVDGGPSERSE